MRDPPPIHPEMEMGKVLFFVVDELVIAVFKTLS